MAVDSRAADVHANLNFEQQRHLPASAAQARNDRSYPLVMLFAFMAPMTAWTVAQNVMSWADLAIALSLPLLLLDRALTKRRLLIPGFMFWVGLALIISGFTTAWVNDHILGFLDAAKLAFAVVITPTVVAWHLENDFKRNFERLMLMWLLGALLSALVAIMSRHGIPMPTLLTDPRAATGGRAVGLAYTTTSLGYCSAMALPVAVYFTLKGPRRLFFSLCAIALLYSVQISGSRASIVGAVLTFVPFGIFYLTASKYSLIRIASLITSFVLIAFGIMILTGTVSLGEPGSAIYRLLNRSVSSASSDEVRSILQNHAWNEFYSAPLLGKGYENIRIAHNYLLQILHAGGIFGLSIFLTWALCLLLKYIEARQLLLVKSDSEDMRLLWVLIAAMTWCWLLHGLTQTYLTDRNGYFWVAALIAVMLSQKRLPRVPESS